jgi:hypothetical protein
MNWRTFKMASALAMVGAAMAGVLAATGATGLFFVAVPTLVFWTGGIVLWLPGLVVLGGLLVAGKRWPNSQHVTGRLAGILAACYILAILLVPSCALGALMLHLRVEQAKAGVQETVEWLEGYKDQHGHYPRNQEEAKAAGLAQHEPWLAVDYDYAAAQDGSWFRLSLMNPFRMFARWSYSPGSRQWEEED